MTVGAVGPFFAPVDLGSHWPWPLTPLLARAVAAWYGMVGTMLVLLALAVLALVRAR